MKTTVRFAAALSWNICVMSLVAACLTAIFSMSKKKPVLITGESIAEACGRLWDYITCIMIDDVAIPQIVE